MDIAVAEDKLSQAIGRGGQNVRLASELTGWQLNVMTQQTRPRRRAKAEQRDAIELFKTKLDVDEEIARHPGAGRLLHDRGNRLRAGVASCSRSRSSTRTSSRSCARVPATRC